MNSPHARQIATTYKAIGATLPESVRNALANADTVRNADIRTGGLDLIAPAIADAVLAGTDPVDDPAVQRAVTVQAFGGPTGDGLDRALQRVMDERTTTAIRGEMDAILGGLADAAQQAGQQLSAARRILGDVELDDETTIIRLGADAVRAWADARDAVATLRIIMAGWQALNTLCRFASDALPPILALTDADLDHVEQLGRRADAWTLVRSDLSIELADATTARERMTKISEQRAAREADQSRARGSLL
ncbi:hypothetical protein [Tomitella fengzijianii]|uniref:Uncharacterized protein n=1 Tax=Tomitella fengzijianii TaxID=2597660 RepID=A0A516X4X8_9ACTN|nr:hypothetical protein [Tomitella fengzijianii]QDQ98104.1 hypothetical protein FO059_13270 [Tomitella fengzijianii]